MYFSSQRQGWYKLDQVDISSVNISTYDTWIDVARFDNDNIDIEFILCRSAYDENGDLIPLETMNGTSASFSFRLIQPNSVAGKTFIDNLVLSGSATALTPLQIDWEPPLAIPQGSKLQVKLHANLDLNTFKVAKLYFLFAYLYNGTNPKITYLLDN